MDRDKQSDTEAIRIWPGQRECTRAMRSRQLQLGTYRGTSGAITAQTKEEAICQLINTHNPCSAMCCEYSTTSHAEMKIEKQQRSRGHNGNKAPAMPFKLVGLSLEKLILFQTDIIWESYIVASYKTNHSDGRLPAADTSTADKLPCLLAIPRESHASSYRSDAAKMSCRSNSKRNIHATKGIKDWEIAVNVHNPLKRKLSDTIKGAEEVRAKQASYNLCKSSNTFKLSKQDSEGENYSQSKTFYGCFTNSDKYLEFNQSTGSANLCSPAEKYPEKQFYSEGTSSSFRDLNSVQACDYTRDGYEICSVKCRLEAMLKDSFLSEIDASIFIPKTDSTADYIVPYPNLTQKGHCKARTDSEESLFLQTSTDSSINPHDSLSLYPQMTSNVIFNNGDEKPIKSQCQLLCEWVSHEKRVLSANMVMVSPFLQKTEFSFIDKQNCHVGSKLFLSTEMSFPTWCSHHTKLKNRHCVPNFSTSVPADSFIGMQRNDFTCSQSSIIKADCYTEKGLQTLQHLPKLYGVKAEQMGMEVTLGKETMDKSTASDHLDYKTALKNQSFCFSSHLLDAAENLEQDTPKQFTLVGRMQSCPKKVSEETFEKISLDMYMVETQSNNPAEANCLTHSEQLVCQKQAIPDSSVAMESNIRGCRKESFGVTSNQLGMSDADSKEFMGVTANKEIVGRVFQQSMMLDTYFYKNSIQNGREQQTSDINYKNKCDSEEHLQLNSSNKAINLSESCMTIGFLSETTLNVAGNVDELKVEGACSLQNGEKPTLNLSGANGPPVDHTVIDVTNLSNKEFVLEELKLFHLIGQSDETTSRADNIKGIEQMCNTAIESPNIVKEDCPSVGQTAIDVTKLSNEESGHVFGMKVQFDLVLEELKLFHLIGQSDTNTSIADDMKGIEKMCNTLVELPGIVNEDIPCGSRTDSNDCGLEDKTLIQTKEQEVPQESWTTTSGDEESLYSPVKRENTANTLSWTPSFTVYGERTITQHIQKEVTFSHGIGRVTPLKTRPGPLRIGLSKKAKIKQLHPYLR